MIREDFLQNYLGMMGIPIEMVPEFPNNAKVVLLTIVGQYSGGYGPPFGAGSGGNNQSVLIPVLGFFTNDSVPLVMGNANGNGFPILLSDHYSKGVLFILTIPDNFADLYSYPAAVVSRIKSSILGDFPVRLDGPNKVSLFVYDNHTFVVESYLNHAAAVTVSITDGISRITDMETGDSITGRASTPQRGFGGRLIRIGVNRMNFHMTIQPHSYAAFSEGQ